MGRPNDGVGSIRAVNNSDVIGPGVKGAYWNDLLRMHASVGFARGVLVQPANYRFDHTYLKEALSRLPRAAYRGIGIMDDSVDDRELERLHDAGVRGMRFNFVRVFKLAPTPQSLRRSIDRIKPYGWFIKIFIGPEELPEYIDLLRTITSVPVVDAIAGKSYVYNAIATDPDGDPLTFALVTAPAGMAVNASTGQITRRIPSGNRRGGRRSIGEKVRRSRGCNEALLARLKLCLAHR